MLDSEVVAGFVAVVGQVEDEGLRGAVISDGANDVIRAEERERVIEPGVPVRKQVQGPDGIWSGGARELVGRDGLLMARDALEALLINLLPLKPGLLGSGEVRSGVENVLGRDGASFLREG